MTKNTRYECWEGKSCGITFSSQSNCTDMRKRGLISKRATKVYTYLAASWEEAMTEHHKRQGWEPYVPFDKVTGKKKKK